MSELSRPALRDVPDGSKMQGLLAPGCTVFPGAEPAERPKSGTLLASNDR
ncbi:hypothetical protein NY08_1523 [Rhodococcus sp. B7740]|nr:hypothetical protein NY08_1523 [Rhodococcus sp. B7740]